VSADSEENVARLRAGIEAFRRTGRIDSGFLAPDFEVHQASSIVDTAGVFRGPDAPQASLRELEESFEELSFDAERFIEAPGGEIVVFIHARGQGRGSGVKIDNHIAWVFTYRDDKPVRLVVYEEQAEALEAVGLAGPSA
jgi:ketosteroid isomerase-like protein